MSSAIRSCGVLLLIGNFLDKRFDAAGVKRERDVAVPAVVFDALDQQFQGAGSFSRYEGLPQVLEIGQHIAYLCTIDEFAMELDHLVVDYAVVAIAGALSARYVRQHQGINDEVNDDARRLCLSDVWRVLRRIARGVWSGFGCHHKKARRAAKTSGARMPFSHFPLRPILAIGLTSSIVRHSCLFGTYRARCRSVVRISFNPDFQIRQSTREAVAASIPGSQNRSD